MASLKDTHQMKRALALGLLTLLTIPTALIASEDAERPVTTFQIFQMLRAKQDELARRASDLQRMNMVLTVLGDGADGISSTAQSPSFSRATRKLEEAQKLSLEEPPLPDAVASVLESFRVALASPSTGFNSARIRAACFETLITLQEFVLTEAEALQREILALQGVESVASQMQIGMRTACTGAIRATTQSWRLALK
jgi:hypothetical protein